MKKKKRKRSRENVAITSLLDLKNSIKNTKKNLENIGKELDEIVEDIDFILSVVSGESFGYEEDFYEEIQTK